MQNPTAEVLASLEQHTSEVVNGLLVGGSMTFGDDSDVMQALTSAGRLLRRLESVITEAVGEVMRRSETGIRQERLTSRLGAHDVSELVQRATLVGPHTVGRWQRAARAMRQDTSLVSGERLEPPFPAMRDALVSGDVGVDGLLAVAGALADVERRVGREALLTADAALAAVARGDGVHGGPAACADVLRVHATAWAVALDQDGSEPSERVALRRRGVHFGRPREGVVPFRGHMLAEVFAQFERIYDATESPRVDGDSGGVRFRPAQDADSDVPLDERTPSQRRHDALATALGVAAASGALPTIGGAAPTVVISVREADLLQGRGWAHADGCDESLPVRAAQHAACAGTVQRVVLNDAGRVLRIGTEERVFNRHQRRAIALRDGGCVIPGCGVPAAWCEVHHVLEHSRGGPTHTDNGVLLCWFHHRFLEFHQWKIRMSRGVPEVQAPPWNDASGRWRPVTKSKTRLADMVIRRT